MGKGKGLKGTEKEKAENKEKGKDSSEIEGCAVCCAVCCALVWGDERMCLLP